MLKLMPFLEKRHPEAKLKAGTLFTAWFRAVEFYVNTDLTSEMLEVGYFRKFRFHNCVV